MKTRFDTKYFKPLSTAWLSSAATLIAGLIIATVDLHGLQSVVSTIDAMTGGIEPAILINAGVIGIGLRGKDG